MSITEEDNKTFTKEFKQLVDKYIQEEISKITTNGKFDKNKAIKYIKDCKQKEIIKE